MKASSLASRTKLLLRQQVTVETSLASASAEQAAVSPKRNQQRQQHRYNTRRVRVTCVASIFILAASLLLVSKLQSLNRYLDYIKEGHQSSNAVVPLTSKRESNYYSQKPRMVAIVDDDVKIVLPLTTKRLYSLQFDQKFNIFHPR